MCCSLQLLCLICEYLFHWHILQVEELGPLEVRIQTLQKQISESVEQCGRLQHFWLRQQYELVRQTQEAQDQHGSVQELKRTLTILEQKKMRLNGE